MTEEENTFSLRKALEELPFYQRHPDLLKTIEDVDAEVLADLEEEDRVRLEIFMAAESANLAETTAALGEGIPAAEIFSGFGFGVLDEIQDILPSSEFGRLYNQ